MSKSHINSCWLVFASFKSCNARGRICQYPYKETVSYEWPHHLTDCGRYATIDYVRTLCSYLCCSESQTIVYQPSRNTLRYTVKSISKSEQVKGRQSWDHWNIHEFFSCRLNLAVWFFLFRSSKTAPPSLPLAPVPFFSVLTLPFLVNIDPSCVSHFLTIIVSFLLAK